MAGAGRRGGALDRAAKRVEIGDRVVGRHHQHQRVGVLGRRARSAATQAAGAVLRPTGSSISASRHDADLAQLLGDDEAVLLVGDDQRRRRNAASPATRRAVSCNRLRSPVSARSCFG